MKTIEDMINFFRGVQAQHRASVLAGYYNPNSQVIIKTYDFVIAKLQEWNDNRGEENGNDKKPKICSKR